MMIKNLFIIVALLVALSVCAYADVDTLEGIDATTTDTVEGETDTDTVEGEAVYSAPSCSTVVNIAEATIHTNKLELYTDTTDSLIGQSYYYDYTGDRPSESFRFWINENHLTSGSGTLTLRIGTSIDLSTYLFEETFTINSGTEDSVVLTFTSGITYVDETTYYAGLSWDQNWGNRLDIGRDSSDANYTGGTAMTGDAWDTLAFGSTDIDFGADICDD